MIKLVRTTSEDENFRELVKLLDADLALRDGEEHSFYAQFNAIAALNHALVLYVDEKPVSCGAIKPFDAFTVEVKRMYTLPGFRGRGFAGRVLNELEVWASRLGYTRCVLETGKRQPEAIKLYEKSGYKIIPNYGQYAGIENSVCFEKKLKNTQ